MIKHSLKTLEGYFAPRNYRLCKKCTN